MAAVASNREIGAYLERAIRGIGAHADDAIWLFQQVDRFRPHPQMERSIFLAVVGEEIEEIPLRHQRDELAAGRQVAEIRKLNVGVADDAVELADFLMRAREKGLEQAELMHDLLGRGVDRIAAEVAQKIAVLFQHAHRNPGARQQKTQHHSGRAAAGDAAGDAMRLVCHRHTCVIMPVERMRG